jgi:hypothetical protein
VCVGTSLSPPTKYTGLTLKSSARSTLARPQSIESTATWSAKPEVIDRRACLFENATYHSNSGYCFDMFNLEARSSCFNSRHVRELFRSCTMRIRACIVRWAARVDELHTLTIHHVLMGTDTLTIPHVPYVAAILCNKTLLNQ